MALTLGLWRVGGVSNTASFSGDDLFSQYLLRACYVLGAKKVFVCVVCVLVYTCESDTQSQEALG